MEQLKLKSKAVNTCDYHSIDISSYAIPLRADQARYERDFKNFCKRFATKEEAAEIKAQDMATISCSSENPKFQKEHITVRIGLNMYSKELEEKLIGMTVGETRAFPVGSDSVTVTVEKSIREVIPELTDELAASSGISYIKTAEDAYMYCRYKQYDDVLEESADNASVHISRQVMEHSSFDLDSGEVETAVQFASQIMNPDSLAKIADDADMEESEVFGKDIPSFIEDMGRHMLMSAVLAQNMQILTEEDYEAYLDKLAVAMQRPKEDIRTEHPLVEYLLTTYNDIFTNTVEEYVFRRLKELGEVMADEAV